MDRHFDLPSFTIKPEQRSTLPDYSVESNPTSFSPPQYPPTHRRSGYQPIATVQEDDTSYRGAEAGTTFRDRARGRGLAIENVETQRRMSTARVPVGSKSPGAGTSAWVDPVLSPSSTRVGNESSRTLNGQFEHESGDLGQNPNRSSASLFQPFNADLEQEDLNKKPSMATIRSYDPPGPEFECRSKQSIYHGRGNWLSIVILVLAIYSTVFSAIWLLLAIIRPRYGRRISTTSNLPPSTASLLCAAFAKSIELSFVTVFVAFLGQVLSRRAFVTKSRGITIAEMTMRAWVMQPGTLITHWETVRHAALTFLGMIALTATLVATLYTTASDALVAPKLKFGKEESRLMYGKVATQFANPDYIKLHCETPIQVATDQTYSGSTCIEINHSGEAYHNYQTYLSDWAQHIGVGNMTSRPEAVGLMYDNTTVHGSWVNYQNMTELSLQNGGRIINNISLAMPHAGVFAAAREPINNIMQPQDLMGLGEYHIRASVPSPVVNILCVGMTQDELEPIIWTAWPNGTKSNGDGKVVNATLWPDQYSIPATFSNATAVDDIFGFGLEKYGRAPPVFPKYPIAFNTILNTTKSYVDSIYLLLASPTSSYTLCSIRQSQTPNCSTEYRASMSGGVLSSRCEDPHDDLAYRRSDSKATNGVLSRDWINVAYDWATALSLNAGISDGNAANARLLSQLTPTTNVLNPSLPTIAEALAVLAGSTLLKSAIDAPFIHYWNYSTTVPTLSDAQYQGFNASVITQDYASGGTQPWQGIFYIVLVLVFVTNVFCLGYFIIRGGLVTDFIEPQNLFALSLNSPPSQRLEGSCGGGPEKEQLRTNYFIRVESERDHVFIHEGSTQPAPKVRKRRSEYEMEASPVQNMYAKLSSKRTSLL